MAGSNARAIGVNRPASRKVNKLIKTQIKKYEQTIHRIHRMVSIHKMLN